VRVLTWNMMHAVVRGAARRLAAWQYLDGLKADIALVQEAGPPFGAPLNAVWGTDLPPTAGADWGTAVVSSGPVLSKFIGPVYPDYYGGRTAIEIGTTARPGTLALARIEPSQTEPLLAISLYGMLRYAEQSVLRAAADVMPIFDDRRVPKLVLLGGDLNIHTHDDELRGRRRAKAILDAVESLGLINLVREARSGDLLEQGKRAVALPCPCDGTDCYHVRTHKHSRHQPGEMANNDYLFATPELAARLQKLVVMNGDADPAWSHSDHCPLVAEFK